MTPTAITPAGGGSSTNGRDTSKTSTSRPAGSRPAGHRAKLRKPAVPRRVSGPAGGASRARPAPAPARRGSVRRTSRAASHDPLVVRAGAFVAALPDHPLLDRLIRGRSWIPILGILLAGIVAMQVAVLKLGAGVGRSIERSTALQSRNEQLRASVASLSDDQRIERLAASMGMMMAAPEAVSFLNVRPRVAADRAATNIHAPDASSFIASLPVIDTPAGAVAAAATDGAVSATPTTADTTTATDSTAATDGTAATDSTAATATPAATTTPVTATAGTSTTPGG